MQPHADDIMGDDLYHGYGTYVQQILLDIHAHGDFGIVK